jgi:glycine/D-amino acid oxidase-like deaminating enzyme
MMTTPYTNPLSFWQTSAPYSAVQTRSASRARVVIIGAGIVGACATYWLSRMNVRTLLLDASLPGNGATGRNGGLCVVGPSGSYLETIERFARDATRAITSHTFQGYEMLASVLREENIDCDFRPNSFIHLALSQDEMSSLERNASALNEDGFRSRMLTRDDLRRYIYTPLDARIVGGKQIEGAAQLHSMKLLRGIVGAAERRGAATRGGVEVRSIQMRGDHVVLETTQDEIHADALVVTVNAWTRQLFPILNGVITPVRGQVFSTAPLPKIFDCGFAVGITSTGEYWQQLPSGEIVIGGCRALAINRDEGILEFDTTNIVQTGIEKVLPMLFPQLTNIHVAHRWSGPMAFTKDFLPILDQVNGAPIYFAGGFSGHGMPFAMIFGKWLAEAATTGNLAREAYLYRSIRETLK